MSLEDFKSRVLPVKNKLFRFAMRLAGNAEDAEDIVQEVFIKVWDRRLEIGSYHSVEAWCMRLVKNRFLDEVKSKRRQTSIRLTEDNEMNRRHEPMDMRTPYQVTELNDTMQKVQELMGALSVKQREIIHLRDVEGYSYQEIAEVMGIDVNQVKVNLFRARAAIRKGLLNAENYGME